MLQLMQMQDIKLVCMMHTGWIDGTSVAFVKRDWVTDGLCGCCVVQQTKQNQKSGSQGRENKTGMQLPVQQAVMPGELNLPD